MLALLLNQALKNICHTEKYNQRPFEETLLLLWTKTKPDEEL